jgi:hypothetical protein
MHQIFAKIWAVKRGPITQKVAWKWTITTNNWVWPFGPQHESNSKCGFYVMMFITKYVEWKLFATIANCFEVCKMLTPLNFEFWKWFFSLQSKQQ